MKQQTIGSQRGCILITFLRFWVRVCVRMTSLQFGVTLAKALDLNIQLHFSLRAMLAKDLAQPIAGLTLGANWPRPIRA